MATSHDTLVADINDSVKAGFRHNLIARGQARAMIWREGVLPPDAPNFSLQLSYDLISYGYSLLGLGLRLREMEEESPQARIAFEQAATALEAVVAKGSHEEEDRHFHFFITAACYHLAHLSARAYSLLSNVESDDKFSPIENVLALLIMRKLKELKSKVLEYRVSGVGSDDHIAESIINEMESKTDQARFTDEFQFEILTKALTDVFMGSMSLFIMAVEHGERQLIDKAISQLQESKLICGELHLVPLWWGHRVAIHLLSDLWANTFHQQLPKLPSGGEASDWPQLRKFFITSLLCRPRTEIDLWPSQIDAAKRAVDQTDDLVVSLPTSAGKTRIAELCILRCLAANKRVFFVTPLRALSAQTEIILQRTFRPLGKSISTLYGSIGLCGLDEDVIRKHDIVVATPEKLDFALRSDPSLLDNVGLIVLDEGHMIGINEREVRFEAQIQRLLQRADADERRIVCLSAILPEGDQMSDFAGWLRRDRPGEAIMSNWRPTRLRYGEVVWLSNFARLDLRVGDERTWLQNFIEGSVPPKGQRKKSFPCNQLELCLATTWRLVDEGHTVLIYCPERRSVETYASRIVDLHNRGSLKSLLKVDENDLNTALSLGKEWFGPNSDILKCLRLGVVLHHGSLPSAYRKEVERLLQEKSLSVTVSSPTLSQGLNLSATALVMHSLYRRGKLIDTSEFKNISGRAGRAYIDMEGIVLFPIFKETRKKFKVWQKLISDVRNREMESGLIKLVEALLTRIHTSIGGDFSQFLEYVVNNAEAWSFPEIEEETIQDREDALVKWEKQVNSLDTAILSLIGDQDNSSEGTEALLDKVLQSSLWQRRLLHCDEQTQQILSEGLLSRCKLIWGQSTAPQRRGYFLAGVGLKAGQKLDAIASEVNFLLLEANSALLGGDAELAIKSITSLAEQLFDFYPFTPKSMPVNWRELLRIWLLGEPLTKLETGLKSETIKFIEEGLVYRLPWAMEAVRVRAVANRDVVDEDNFLLDDFELSLAVTAVETGTINCSASILIQAGFSSRLAAIKAVSDTGATFTNENELRSWLESEEVTNSWSIQPDWPTAETKAMWINLLQRFKQQDNRIWSEQHFSLGVDWSKACPDPGTLVQVFQWEGQWLVLADNGFPLGRLQAEINPDHQGLIQASISSEEDKIEITYFGSDVLLARNTN